MIGYIAELANPYDEPRNHQWLKDGPDKYRSFCGRWTQSKENIANASEVNCMWCLRRRQNLPVESKSQEKASAQCTCGASHIWPGHHSPECPEHDGSQNGITDSGKP